MFTARGLTKRFAGVHVLRGVSFEIADGEILGYLGANGSGKSTTIKIIAGLLDPTGGSLLFDGRPVADDPVAFRRVLGYVPDEPALYTHLTAPEYLRLVGRLRGLPATRLEAQIRTLLDILDLAAASGAAMATFSKGMRQRVLIGAALLHNPALLLFDEPFSGLDVGASALLLALLQALARHGKMILLSSHRLDLIDTLCHRVVILHRGHVAASGSPSQLRAAGHRSLDEVFAQVTRQEDYSARAQSLVDLVM